MWLESLTAQESLGHLTQDLHPGDLKLKTPQTTSQGTPSAEEMSLAASTETLARALALKTLLTTSPGTPSGEEMSLTFLGRSTILKSQADPGNLIYTTAETSARALM